MNRVELAKGRYSSQSWIALKSASEVRKERVGWWLKECKEARLGSEMNRVELATGRYSLQ